MDSRANDNAADARPGPPRASSATEQALARLRSTDLEEDQHAFLDAELPAALAACPDPPMALLNFERFLAACTRRDAFFSLLRRRRRALDWLLRLFGGSQSLSEILIRDPKVVEWLIAGPDRLDRNALFGLLWDDLLSQTSDSAQLAAIRAFRNREMLRIGYNDIVRGVPLEVVTNDLSHLADACLEAACRIARARMVTRHGEPRDAAGRPLRFVILALGKLGGEELNYSSDIDLIFLYEADGVTSGASPTSNAEFFSRMGSEIIRLLSEHGPSGQAYRVDMRLRPEGKHGPLARSVESALGYYETQGRTWERQAFIKCRPAAGDLNLGFEFLEALAPFVFRRYLSAAEILEIKSLKRRIESRAISAGEDHLDVKTGHGGIRDVEYVVQFLQLLHGGTERSLRCTSTLQALGALEQVGCITAAERSIMDDTYRFLRQIEHRLQLLYDRQTHTLPRESAQLRVLARRLGYERISAWEHHNGPLERFLSDYRAKTDQNRGILDHLLHDAFGGEPDGGLDALVNLVLDPEPSGSLIREALAPYPFRSPDQAYQNIMALAHENIEFLSQPRCRHFLAAIAPALLRAIAQTLNPDTTLTNLERVSASLGAKAILWELFSHNPPSLRLYVELCAKSQFLSEILIGNPGMIDDLIDSLVFDRPASAAAIADELAELCAGAEDLGPILLGFRNKEWLRIGARDILGREPIRKVTRELSDVAAAIVSETAHAISRRNTERVGTATLPGGRPAGWAILAMGKLGGRELMYHSDLDLVFLYEGEGEVAGTHPSVSNARFFASLAQQTLRVLAGGERGHALYEVDTRLRPHGASGELAIPLVAFIQYFQDTARAWERMALTRARVIFQTESFGARVDDARRAILMSPGNPAALARDCLETREHRLRSHAPDDLKWGIGGMADIEFIAQFLQMIHAASHPEVLKTNTWEALAALGRVGVLTHREHRALRNAFNQYRTAESRVRLLQNQSGIALTAASVATPDLQASRAERTDESPGTRQSRLVQSRECVSDILDRHVRGLLGATQEDTGCSEEPP